jgi:hypothetical protein
LIAFSFRVLFASEDKHASKKVREMKGRKQISATLGLQGHKIENTLEAVPCARLKHTV